MRDALCQKLLHPVLRLFLGASPVDGEKNIVELYGGLRYRNQGGVRHFIGTEAAQTIDGAQQCLYLDGALSGKAPERREVKPGIFVALDKTMPREIVERVLKREPVPAGSIAGLLPLEYTEAGFEKADDVVARHAFRQAACRDKNADDQGAGIGIEETGCQILRPSAYLTMPIIMFFVSAGCDQIGRTTFGESETSGAPDEVFVFGDAVGLLARMFEADDDDRGGRRVDAHGERGGGDDHAKVRVAPAEMLLNDAPFLAVEM
jgi:hypothetical protein